MHVRDDERLAQHLDHRDRRAHAGLEAQLDARARGRVEELGAALRDELLVRGDDVLAAPQQLEHVLAGRLDAAHHLADDRDLRVVEDLADVRREHTRRSGEAPLLVGRADERLHEAQPVAGRALDVVGLLVQQAVDGGADRAVAEEGDGDVNRRHGPPGRFRSPSARSRAPTCSISVCASALRAS